MEAFANPFTQILFVLTLVVISLSVISIRIQKANKLQRKSFEQSQVRTDTDYSSIGVFFQGDRTLVKCPSCAELISIEAKICKACRTNVEKYVAEVESEILRLKKENQELEALQKQIKAQQNVESIKLFKKSGIILAGVSVVVFGIVAVASFVQDKYFPTRIEKLAIEWKNAFVQCGFPNIDVIIGDESDQETDNINSPSLYAEARFLEDVEKYYCVRSAFDAIYEKFNRNNDDLVFVADYYMNISLYQVQFEREELAETKWIMHLWDKDFFYK